MTYQLPDRKFIHDVLTYDPTEIATFFNSYFQRNIMAFGLLRWRGRHGNMINGSWNTRYAGKIAGRYAGKTCYIAINNIMYPVANICWLHWSSEPVPKMIDHRNGNHWDNRPENWREANYSQNNANRPGHARSTTGIKNVYARGDKFEVRISHQGTRYELGTYNTIQEAKAAADYYRQKLHGEFARE